MLTVLRLCASKEQFVNRNSLVEIDRKKILVTGRQGLNQDVPRSYGNKPVSLDDTRPGNDSLDDWESRNMPLIQRYTLAYFHGAQLITIGSDANPSVDLINSQTLTSLRYEKAPRRRLQVECAFD